MPETATPLLGSLLPSLLALIAILVLIPGVFWLLKRTQMIGTQGAGSLKVVAALAVGPRERIVVIHAGGKYLVVGMTGQSMNLLTSLDEWPESENVPANEQASFASLLKRFSQPPSRN